MDFIIYSLLGVLFIFVMHTLGASLVFFTKNKISKSSNYITLGFAAGIRNAAILLTNALKEDEKAKNKDTERMTDNEEEWRFYIDCSDSFGGGIFSDCDNSCAYIY